MKPQFSPIPREIDKFILALGKVDSNKGSDHGFDETIAHLVGPVHTKLREATHFELPPREINDFGGYYTVDDILAACDPELKLPYPAVSVFRVISGQPTFILAWDKLMWLEQKEELGNIIHIYALAKVKNVWYPAQAELRIEPDNVLMPERLRDGTFAIWHGYGWSNSKAPRGSDGRLSQKWFEELSRDVIELCALLRLPACKVETQRESRLKVKLGASAKKGKLKTFYDVHRLVITQTVEASSSSEPKGGTHASPRWHKRRGYWRTMKKSGKTVWVQACEVGKKSNGMVYKDYEVKVGGQG